MIALDEMGRRAVTAKYMLQTLTEDKKNQALLQAAKGLQEGAEEILAANEIGRAHV